MATDGVIKNVTVSDLIKVLEDVKSKFGDLKVAVGDTDHYVLLDRFEINDGPVDPEENHVIYNCRGYKEQKYGNVYTYVKENGLDDKDRIKCEENYKYCMEKYGKEERFMCLYGTE